MLLLLLSFAWLIAVIILIRRALRQRTIFRELAWQSGSIAQAPSVTIVVPARNEAGNIERCLESLFRQDYPQGRAAVFAVDDNSTDGTASLIEKEAKRGLVTLLKAPPLPAGWTGKSHACWIGALSACEMAEWLCFADADIEATPSLLGAAVARAISDDIDFLSLTPKQRLISFAERLIMPSGLFILAFSQDLADVNAPNSKDITASGQFILVRSAVYEAIGGHKAVQAEICEDLALARLAKSRGYKTALFGGTALYATRMYRGWSDLWPGVTKNLTVMLGGRARTIATACIALSLAWAAPLLPLADAIECHDAASCAALAFAAPASAAAFALHLAGTAFFDIPIWYGLIFPLGYTIGAVLAFDSVRRSLTGRIRWKGRTYS